MEHYARLARTYLGGQVSFVVVLMFTAILSSMSSFSLTFLTKVTVDEVLQVQVTPDRSARGVQAGGKRDSQVKRDLPTTAVRVPGPRDGSRSATTKAEQIRKLWLVFGAFVAVRILFSGANWFYAYGIARVGQRMVFRLRKDVYRKLQKLQVSYIDRYPTGKIVARVMDDVNAVESSISSVFIRMVTDFATLGIGLVILFSVNARLAFYCCLTLPFYLVAYRIFIRRIRPINRMIRDRNASLYGVIGDTVTGARVVMSFVRERYERRRFLSALASYLRLRMSNSRLNTGLSVLCGLVSGIGTTIVVYAGVSAVGRGEMTPGQFLFFYGSLGYLFTPVVSLSDLNVNLQWVTSALTRIFEVIDEDVSIEDGKRKLTDVHGEVIFHDVSLSYDEGKSYALRHLNFAVFPGQSVCIVGPSGSGKTSLLNLLLRFYSPTSGRITLDGEDIGDVSLSSLRRAVGIVPQSPMLFSGTIAENIRYGYPEASPNEVVAAARAAELDEHILKLPAKYETHVGEGGDSLSGGQKQRMAIAMTLITDPAVLVIDDGTSALDAKTEGRVHRTLDRVMKGRTSFVVTHKVSVARKADLILVLDRGRLVERGTHDLLVSRRGCYARLFEHQLSDSEKAVRPDEVEHDPVPATP